MAAARFPGAAALQPPQPLLAPAAVLRWKARMDLRHNAAPPLQLIEGGRHG